MAADRMAAARDRQVVPVVALVLRLPVVWAADVIWAAVDPAATEAVAAA